jgi:hypothetical protein
MFGIRHATRKLWIKLIRSHRPCLTVQGTLTMENKNILVVYLIAWLVYLLGINAYSLCRHMNMMVTTISHFVPLVATTMSYIFLVLQGNTVAQFAFSSSNRQNMDLWSLWFRLWPLLLLLSFIAGIVHCAWIIRICFKTSFHRWLPVSITSVLMCLFAFFTVLLNFPDA